jgi:hypothetical protein
MGQTLSFHYKTTQHQRLEYRVEMTNKHHERLTRILITNGCLAEDLRSQLVPGASADGVMAYAQGKLNRAIQCIEFSLEPEALELLTKSEAGMTAALQRAVEGEFIELEYRRHFDLSVCRWLLGPPALAHDLTRGYNLLLESDEMVHADLMGNADLLDSVLTTLVYAQKYEQCIAKYEHELAKAPRTKQQKHDIAMKDYYAGHISADEAAFLQQDRIEAPMGYLVARERLCPSLTESHLRESFEVFLRQRVPVWLKYARRDLLTMWGRIITQVEAGDTARTAIRDIVNKYA